MQDNKNDKKIAETVSAESVFAIVAAIIIATAAVFVVSLSKQNKALNDEKQQNLEEIAQLQNEYSELEEDWKNTIVESDETNESNQKTIEEQQELIEDYEQQIEENGKELAEKDETIDRLIEIIGEEDTLDEVYSRSVSADDATYTLRQTKAALLDMFGESEKTASIIENIDKQIAEIEDYEEHYPDYCPTTGTYSSPYGWRENPFDTSKYSWHSGIDIANSVGTPVYAAAGGKVVYAGTISGYGYCILIDHGNGIKTRYAHLSKMLVSAGDTVKKTDKIALMGATGRVTGPHLHFEVIVNGNTVDPLKYIPMPTK